MRVLLTGLFLIAAGELGPRAWAVRPVGEDSRESLERFLIRMRTERDQHVNELRGRVEALVRVMETEAATQRQAGLADARTRMVALGGECAPLLVERLDPGENPSQLRRLLADTLTLTLMEIPTPAITHRLLEMAQKGSETGRVNALRVLAVTTDPERVNPVVDTIYRTSQGEVRMAALTTLARIGGKENEQRIEAALADPNAETVRQALDALTNARVAALSERVLGLLEVTHRAIPYGDQFLRYYRACPTVVDKRHLAGLVHLAQDAAATNEMRVRILDYMTEQGDKLDNDLRKEIRTIGTSLSAAREVRESALVLLSNLGDKNARKLLIDEYDAQVERGKTWANSYEARGNILYRIGDYREAINDYKKALSLASSDFRARQDNSYIGLARCHMQLGKLKDAVSVLEKAPLSAKQLADLAQEPIFAKLVEHPKYGAILRGE